MVRGVGFRFGPNIADAPGSLASNSGTHDSFISDHTCVTHVVAMHTHGYTALAALVDDYCAPGGEMSFGQVTGTARFYYEPTGTTTWRYLGADRATSGEDGSVALGPAGTLHGHFKIVFPAQGYYLASTSSIAYLS